MAIIPRRGQVGQDVRRGRGPRLPGGQDVPTVNPAVARDPGLQADPSAFGADIGQATEQIGEGLIEIGRRRQNRDDAFARARDFGNTTQELSELARTFETSADLSDPEQLQQFNAQAEQLVSQAIQNHRGSEDSKSRLVLQLEEAKARTADRLAVRSVEISRERIDQQTRGQFNRVALEAMENPGSLAESFDAVDRIVDDKAPGLDPNTEDLLRRVGRATVAAGVVDSFLRRGDPDGALAALQRDEVSQALTGQSVLQMRNRIADVRRELTAGANEGLKARQKARALLGEGATEENVTNTALALEGVDPGLSFQSLNDQILVFDRNGTIVRQISAPSPRARILAPEEAQAAGFPKGSVVQEAPDGELDALYTPEGASFGRGTRGASLDFVVELAPGFAAGTLGPEEESRFRTAVGELQQPRTVQNPDTGMLETIVPRLPPAVLSAYEQRGEPLPPALADDPAAAERAAQMQGLGRPGDSPLRGAQPAGSGGGASQPATQGEGQELTPPTPEGDDTLRSFPPEAQIPDPQPMLEQEGAKTIAEDVLAGNLTGPSPVLGRLLSRIPGEVPVLGGIRAPEQTSAAQFLNVMRTRLTRVLQNNPRFAEAERQFINREVAQLDPSFFDNPESFMDRVIGMDRALERIQQESIEAATRNRPLVSGETAQMAADTAVAIARFRELLLPPRMESVEKAQQFISAAPPGSKFTIFNPESNRWEVFETTGESAGNEDSEGVGPQGSLQPDESGKVPEDAALKAFTDAGLDPVVAAGFVGNLVQESSLNPNATGDEDKSTKLPQSFGLFQHNRSRAKQLFDFARERGEDVAELTLRNNKIQDDLDKLVQEGKVPSAEAQIAFALQELETTESAAADAIRAATDPGEAAQIIAERFFRPSDPQIEKRIAAAQAAAQTTG